MPPVVIPGRVIVLETVQPVFQRMVGDLVHIQVIADGIGVAVHIDLAVLPKVHREGGGQSPGKLPGESDPVYQIFHQIPRVLAVFCQFRESGIPLFLKFHHSLKQSGGLHPLLKALKIYGQAAEHQRGLSPLLHGAVQFL